MSETEFMATLPLPEPSKSVIYGEATVAGCVSRGEHVGYLVVDDIPLSMVGKKVSYIVMSADL